MITIGFCTRQHNDDYIKHLLQTCNVFKPKKIEIIEIINNGSMSLSECYNEILNKAKNDIIIFLHDDLIFQTNQWGVKIIKLFENNPEYGIIGLAGTDTLVSGMWWEKRDRMFGQVKHQHEGRTWKNSYSGGFGDNLKEVVCVDGLFFAVHKKRLKENFDEDFKGFHFYDIPFCVTNYMQGVKIGVTTKIMVIHKSIGMVDKKWELNKMFFEAKYGEKLPLTI